MAFKNLEDQIAGLLVDVGRLRAAVSGAASDILQVISDVTGLGTRMGTAETDITALGKARIQVNTTNSLKTVVTQYGIGMAQGVGAVDSAKSVTFPVAFTEIPIVVVATAGYRNHGLFDPAGLTSAATLIPSHYGVSKTGMTANLRQSTGGLLGSAQDWYFTWTATGPIT